MADNEVFKKLANVPLCRPGFDTLGMSAPVIVQMNPEGNWETKKPDDVDDKHLKTLVEFLVNSNAVSAASSYCSQCAQQAKKDNCNIKSNYVPVIMMPVLSADECPFDMDCIAEKMKKEEEAKAKAKATTKQTPETVSTLSGASMISKPKAFVLQRLTDFDLSSQWCMRNKLL